MNVPLVSVVIPTLNRCLLLPTAVQSVLNQTFQDFELLVVDDGSTDGTERIRDTFHDPRIRWLRHATPRGGGAARNTGIREAKGKLIAFLDDDDEWYPDKLARQTDLMLASPDKVGVIYTGYVVVERMTGNIKGRMTPRLRGDLHAQLLRSNPIGGTSSVLVRKASLEQVNGFDEHLPSFQDRDLWIRISRAYHFDCISDSLLNYYVHPNKVWSNLDALSRGLELIVAKHGASISFRRQCSKRYLEFGLKFFEQDRATEGRHALFRAISLDPFAIRPYVYASLALLGNRAFVTARKLRTRLAARAKRSTC